MENHLKSDELSDSIQGRVIKILRQILNDVILSLLTL